MSLRNVMRAWVLLGLAACGGGGTIDPSPGGGGPAPAPTGSSSVLKDIVLAHKALVFDPSRGVYYASVPGSVIGTGNTIARIDAATGGVTYSRTIGSEPGPLALSRDGGALYVGASGSGEVVKLGLPSFDEQWRAQLPASQFTGQLTAEHLAVKPDDADAVAVSMRNTGYSPKHEGVALIRGGALQPRKTQTHTGANLITFGADGSFVYGFNNETTEFGLRRIAVAADGLTEESVVQSAGADFGTRNIDLMGSQLVLDTQVYAAPGLTPVGQVSGARGCRAMTQGNRLLCFGVAPGTPSDGTIAVVDAVSFRTIATRSFRASDSEQTPFDELVPGPSGQVALRQDVVQTATGIRLMSNAALQ